MRVLLSACLALGATAACTPSSGRTENDAGDTTAAATLTNVQRLEREARAITRADGCATSDACRAAPLGAKACGGPREYIMYCATTTDTAALHRALSELERAERAYNEREGIASDCMLITEPSVELVGGSCRAAATAPSALPSRAP